MLGRLASLSPLQGDELILGLLLAALPVFAVVRVSGVWVCFFAIIISYNLFLTTENRYLQVVKAHYLTKPNNYLLSVYLAYFVFSLGSVLLLNSSLNSIDNACIFLAWLAISPIMAILIPNSRVFGYGCLSAVVIALAIAMNQFYLLDIRRPYGMYGGGSSGTGAIKFGDVSLLLGILSFIFLSENQLEKLGALGAFIGFIVCLYTGARGGLFALLLGVLVWFFYFKNNRLSLRVAVSGILLSVAGFFIIDAIMNNALLTRIHETSVEFFSLFNKELDTSIGIRLQLWKAALIMFKNHPVVGVGLNNFDSALMVLNKDHLVSDAAAKYTHAHNEYLCSLATGGIIGFVLTCLLFVIPILWFKKDYQQNAWAKSGFWGVLLMSFFALTDCMFDRRMTVMLFAILVALCMAGNISQKHLKNQINP